MNRRSFFGWLAGVLVAIGFGGPSPSAQGKENRRSIYRRTPGGSTQDRCRPAYVFSPIDWNDQKPGDFILCLDWSGKEIIRMEWWIVETSPRPGPLGLITCTSSGRFEATVSREWTMGDLTNWPINHPSGTTS